MNSTDRSTPSLEDLLTQARRRIEVEPAELAEARRRRAAVSSALLQEFPGSRTYVNGSIAHGDALTPLTDVDLGVVIAGLEQTHGPGRKGPRELMDRAADAIREHLKDDFDGLHVTFQGRKRSVLVRFREPIRKGQPDFTADVIVAVDNPDAPGLFIPRHQFWDRSHPEEHTRLVLAAITSTDVAYARIVRLVKHWNRAHGKPLCSWNIKALALGCLTAPSTQLDGLQLWFRYAHAELQQHETADPARVAAKPITLNVTRGEAVDVLRDANKRLAEAVALQDAGYPLLAHDTLAKMFNDDLMLPRPDHDAVRDEERRRATDQRTPTGGRVGTTVGGAAALAVGIGAGAARAQVPVRSWAP